MGTCVFRPFVKLKPSTDRHEIMSDEISECSKFGCNPSVRGTYAKYKLLRQFLLIFYLRHAHRSNGSTDSYTLHIIMRQLTQGGAFGVSSKKLYSGGLSFQETTNRKSGSGFSQKLYSPVGGTYVAADAFSREGFENGKTDAENISRLLLRSLILYCE
jgi:hypothetical protein